MTPPPSSAPRPPSDALVHAVDEVEQYVADHDWDGTRKIFALVRTTELLAHEPGLVGQIGPADGSGAELAEYTPVEQEELRGESVAEALAKIAWPDAVDGCVLVLEIVSETEQAHHEGRMSVGVLRDQPGGMCALRWRHAPHGPVVRSADLAPELIEALHSTFVE